MGSSPSVRIARGKRSASYPARALRAAASTCALLDRCVVRCWRRMHPRQGCNPPPSLPSRPPLQPAPAPPKMERASLRCGALVGADHFPEGTGHLSPPMPRRCRVFRASRLQCHVFQVGPLGIAGRCGRCLRVVRRSAQPHVLEQLLRVRNLTWCQPGTRANGVSVRVRRGGGGRPHLTQYRTAEGCVWGGI